jgi:hypothetical protein
LLTAAIVGNHHVIPSAMLNLFEMRRAHFDVESFVTDEPHHHHPRADVERPAPRGVFGVSLAGDRIRLLRFGKKETGGNRKGLSASSDGGFEISTPLFS